MHSYALARMVKGNRDKEQRQEDKSDPAFDRWVSRQLHKIYDEVLTEEVPPELLAVVERFGEKPAPEEGGGPVDDEPSIKADTPDQDGKAGSQDQTARNGSLPSGNKRRD